ncbi:Dynein heavy chain 9, axonemal [Chamberlinius hualienensis]
MTDQLDSRYNFISEWTFRFLRIKPDIGHKLLSVEPVKLAITEFLESETCLRLVIYPSSGNQLTAENDFPSIPRSTWIYFVKKEQGILPTRGFKKFILYGQMVGSAIIEFLPAFVKGILIPLYENPDLVDGWPSSIVKAIRNQLEELGAEAEHIAGLVKGNPVLALPSRSALQRNGDEVMSTVEMIAVKWIKLAELILQQDTSHVLHVGQLPGPMHEVNAWRKRKEIMQSLNQQLSSPEVCEIMEIMERNGSNYLPSLKDIMKSVEKSLEEAKDISVHLNPLQTNFQTLETAEFSDLPTLLSITVHVVALAWSTSKCYSASQSKLILMLRLLANQLVHQTKAFLDPATLFQLEITEGLEKVEKALELLHCYKTIIAERHWDFITENDVFVEVNLLISRLTLLQEVYQCSVELSHLEKIEIGNRKGRVLALSIGKIRRTYIETYQTFANRSDDPFDSSNQKFILDHDEFIMKVGLWNKQLGRIFSEAFDDCTTPQSVYKLIAMFTPLLDNPIIKSALDLKYPHLIQLLTEEMKHSMSIYESLLVNEQTFFDVNGLPPVASKLHRVHQLRERISSSMGPFQQSDNPMVSSDESKAVFKSYRHLMTSLEKLEMDIVNDWKTLSVRICHESLNKTLIQKQKDNGFLIINLDPKLSILLKEIHYFEMMELMKIPSSIKNALSSRKESLIKAFSTITRLANCYNRLKGNETLPEEFSRIQQQMAVIDDALRPAELEYKWIDINVRSILSQWSSCPMFARRGPLMHLEERQDIAKKRSSEILAIKDKIHNLLKESDELLTFPSTLTSENSIYTNYLEKVLIESLSEIVRCSLMYLLENTELAVTNPLVEVKAMIDDNVLEYLPPLYDKYSNCLPETFKGMIKDAITTSKLLSISPLELKDEEVLKMEDEIFRRANDAVEKIFDFMRKFDYLSYLWTSSISEWIKTLPINKQPNLNDFKSKVEVHCQHLSEVKEMPNKIVINSWIRLNLKFFKQGLINLIYKKIEEIKDYLMLTIVSSLQELEGFIAKAENGFSSPVKEGDHESLVIVMRHLIAIKERQEGADAMFQHLNDTVDLLRNYDRDIPEDVYVRLQELPERWNSTKKLAVIIKQQVVPLQQTEIGVITRKFAVFEQKVNNFKNGFRDSQFFQPTCKHPYQQLNKAHSDVTQMEKEMAEIMESSFLFEAHVSDLKNLKYCRRDISRLKLLWDHILMVRSMMDEWKTTAWKEIDIEQMELECKRLTKDIRALDKDMKSWEAFLDLEMMIKNLLTALRAVGDLRNSAIRQRHWEQLMEATGVEFQMNSKTTLADLLALNLHNYEDEVRGIVDRAVKEMSTEKTLQEFNATWSTMKLEHEIHHRTGCPLLKASEDLIAILEDNQVQMQNLLTSKHIGHFMEEVSKWQKQLATADVVIGALLEVQRTWIHLENIFIHSEDLRQQLPHDSARFDHVDDTFRALLTDIGFDAKVIESTNRPGLHNKLEEIQMQLSLCEKALAQYLDTKRLAFPRFYFVSSADLLDILSCGQSPFLVMKHLTKLFDSIANLKFQEKSVDAIGMTAKDGEYVPFDKPCQCQGQVEVWLNKLLDISQSSLRHHLSVAVTSYEDMSRDKWLLEFPAQVALCASQVWWTAEVTAAFGRLEEGFDNALKDYYKKQIQQLNMLITMLVGELTPGDRQKIMTMCTIDVHARDVVSKMVANKIDSSQAFLWQSQLRHRWDNDENDCFADICDAQFRYCYEYLGNTPRLVITPLTDRCYITLTQSLHLIMGGGTVGPAGTGKTETTKDLGRALGMMVYVFNCSEQMDYKSCASLYKGLAQSGAWGCFDEFNRISVEVLSVVGVQVKAILDGIKDKRKRFELSGEDIALNPTVGLFITMNPGYAGRTELPENVKALFRPCAMVVPDFELICEIMLVAEGFLDARRLARKFITLYTLCKELLSKQDHYDWGLRAIKSVLVVAGSLKRTDPGRPEDQVLMRALRDFNIPKIVTEDVPIFMGLIGDLFPLLDVPRKRDLTFEASVRDACVGLHLQPEDGFVLKVVQLAELLNVRHSVFIVGNAGTGKTKVWKTLLRTYSNMGLKPIARDLDPKGVSNDELFGLFSTLMRELANTLGEAPKWIILDGDIDPMWIESLNTVMDDNKILTLASNERIALTRSMRLLFEITTLKHATPATVSRAGILYVNPQDLGWNPYVASWIERRSNPSEGSNLAIFFDKYVPSCLDAVKNRFKKITAVTDIGHVQMLCYLLECLITPENINSCSSSATNLRETYELYFVFACIWAFGAPLLQDLNSDQKAEFSKWWLTEFKTIKFPQIQGLTVFDYAIDPSTLNFIPWQDNVPSYDVDPDLPLQATLVHTVESTRLSYFLKLLITNQKPVMLVGTAGCGKTLLVNELLSSFSEEEYSVTKISFHFYTSSEMLQRALEKSLEKKAGRKFGPVGGRKLIYFIDEMNMPEVDIYDTVQPHTLVRQHLAYGHWYDRQKLILKDIYDCQYVSCMNPTAGSFTVNPRLLRHFCIFGMSFPSQNDLNCIYSKILDGHLNNPSLQFNPMLSQMTSSIVTVVVGLHQKVTACFLPTSLKFHYIFNLRDLSNLFQGLLFSTADAIHTPSDLLRLLVHESRRVYRDKLVEEKEVDMFNKILHDVLKKNYEEFDETILHDHPLIYCHFSQGIGEPKYNRVQSWSSLSSILQDTLRSYNEINANMDLVLFEDAMQHICRINRILESPRGNAILVGVGGSGKQSLARLAAYISGLEVTQISTNKDYNLQDFTADLASLHIKAGVKNVPTMFLVTDAQIVNERFLVLINDLLASGEVADLFPPDQLDNIIASLRSEVKAAGIADSRENCYKFFIDRIRRQLKVVLCFSPVGDTLRKRSRKFPAIINGTCIDWFHEWPQEALISVSQQFLHDVDIIPPSLKPSISLFMAFVHLSVNDMSKVYLQNEKRYNYTTPKSFLEYINLYINLIKRKAEELKTKMERLDNGLKKLEETSGQVEDLKSKLAEQEKELKQKNEDADKLIQVVALETKKVTEEKALAAAEEEKVAAINVEVSKKQKDCEEDLVKAEPALIAAQEALNTLNKNNLTELKSFGSPPAAVANVASAVMVLMATGGKVPKDRSWKAAKCMMAKVDQFLDDLIKFDKEHIHPDVLKAIKPYLDNPEFNPDFVRSKSLAAAGLCSWVINIIRFYGIYCEVEPKRIALREANEELAVAQESLANIRAKVKYLEEELAKLTAEFERATLEKMRCEKEAESTLQTIQLANRLVGGLASENVRWAEAVASFKAMEKTLPADILLVSAFVCYVGCFTKSYRLELVEKKWMPFLLRANQENPLPVSPDLDLISLLTDDAQVAEWNNEGLPNDRMSTENATIFCSSERWPLIIDPQLQGVKWLKQRHQGNLTCLQFGQKGFYEQIETAVKQGSTTLIENIGETIDPMLDPLLGRITIKKGTAIKIGDKEIEYNSTFRLMLHTKLANPHYKPELQAQTTLINFTVTKDGLEDQLLAEVVKKERPELETMKADLTKQQNDFKITLKDLEDQLLLRLSTAQGNFLSDAALVDNLETTKKTATDIARKVAEAKQTEITINKARELYRPAAARASLLYFILNDLCKINPIYQFSLKAFKVVFNKAIERAEKSDDLNSRVANLIDSITYSVFLYTTRGLFERDKLTFTVQLVFQVLIAEGTVDVLELDFLIRCPIIPNMISPVDILSNGGWGGVKALSNLETFRNLDRDIETSVNRWKKWAESETPEKERFPQEWKNKTQLQNLCMMRVLRPDRMIYAITDFIAAKLGDKYVQSRTIDLEKSFDESAPSIPFFFILSPGVNPLKDVEELGSRFEFTYELKNFYCVSLGQGQETNAEQALFKAATDGHWVILQNIHLVKTWLPTLETLLEEAGEIGHPNFRVFLTAEPAKTVSSHIIPQGILESAIKITNEPPSGIKANLHKALDNFHQETLESCSKEAEFKSILFSLCYFHAVISERAKFGAQGWNQNYPFNAGDLKICVDVLRNYLEAGPTVPWEDLRYLFGEIMYGGHITDGWDSRVCKTYLEEYLRPEQLEGELQLAPDFPTPPNMDYICYHQYIDDALPSENPLLYGLHSNTEIGFLTTSTETLFKTVLELRPQNSGMSGGMVTTREEKVKQTLDDLLEKLPDEFNIPELSAKVEDKTPYVVVALQECERINVLLREMRRSLIELDLGLKGELTITDAMDGLANGLYLEHIPSSWVQLSYPSLMGLNSWYADLLQRYKEMESWTNDFQMPAVVWLPGFFNPQSFLTAIMQSTARKNEMPLDKMCLQVDVTKKGPEDLTSPPRDGVYVHGLVLEGARWDTQIGSLVDPIPKELHPVMPVIHIRAIHVDKQDLRCTYDCPVYKTRSRGNTYVWTFHLKTKEKPSKWVLAGVALLLQT